MAKAARKAHGFCYPSSCAYTYQRCDGPGAGQTFIDYAAHGQAVGECSNCPTGTPPPGSHCINVQLSTLKLFGKNFEFMTSAVTSSAMPAHNGWPARPHVNPAVGRIIEDYHVRFKIIALDGSPRGPERFAYIPLMEVYPTGHLKRTRVHGPGIEISDVDATGCEPMLALKLSEFEAIGILGLHLESIGHLNPEAVVRIWLSASA